MKKNIFTPLLFIIATLLINACTTIIDASTKDPLQPDPSQRSFGTYIDDKKLEVIVGVNIRKADSRLRQSSNVNITSFNGVILLTGQAPAPELRILAGDTATKVHGVRQVHNEIQMKGNSPFLTRSNDTWLGTKVKTALLAGNNVKGLKIKVIVEDAVVYLMGLATQAEANIAANLSSNVSGVKEVVRVFEYTN
ncbi:MAG: osmotically-inducible protein OsmY [Cellvibrionaceae bacterium]|jgi:osmotically-inducible protein OsmY